MSNICNIREENIDIHKLWEQIERNKKSKKSGLGWEMGHERKAIANPVMLASVIWSPPATQMNTTTLFPFFLISYHS